MRIEERIELPSLAFGIDVQNYGSESQLIYCLDIEQLDPSIKNDEALITKPLIAINCKIDTVISTRHGKTVIVIGEQKEPETIFWPCPNCNQDTDKREFILCCSRECLKMWLDKNNSRKVNEI